MSTRQLGNFATWQFGTLAIRLHDHLPQVLGTVHGTKVEDGVVVEDVSWESLDEERAPAWVIHQPPGEHTFSMDAFEAMTEFFKTHLMGD